MKSILSRAQEEVAKRMSGRVRRLRAHPSPVSRSNRLTARKAGSDLVPILDARLSSAPTEIDPTSVQRGREVQKTMFETSGRKTHPSGYQLVTDQLSDVVSCGIECCHMLLELSVVGIALGLDRGAPNHVQYLQPIPVPFDLLTQALQLKQHGLELSDEAVGLLDGECFVGPKLFHGTKAVGLQAHPLSTVEGWRER